MTSKFFVGVCAAALMVLVKANCAETKPDTPRVLPNKTIGSLVAELEQRMPGANSERFKKPSEADQRIFHKAVENVLNNRPERAAKSLALVNYELASLTEQDTGETYQVVLEKTQGSKGLGTYIFNPKWKRNIVIEVPHPLFDQETPEEGGRIFQETNARALFVAGTHRCANSEPSPCSGETSVCEKTDTSFRVSDAGHYTNNFFQQSHDASLKLKRPPVAISLHGNGNALVPDVVLSDGTTRAAKDKLVNRLRSVLKDSKVTVKSCNFKADKISMLCGTTNVQGRLSNGSRNACSKKAGSSSERFLHIEQHAAIRHDPTRLIKAIKKVLPVRQ